MLRKTIYLPTFYQTVHFSDATSLTREYDSYYMTHVYDLYEMDLVERNIVYILYRQTFPEELRCQIYVFSIDV